MLAYIQGAKALVLGAAIIGIVLAFGVLNHARKKAIARAENLQLQLGLAQANEEALKNAIDDQNAKIVGLQIHAAAIVAKGAAAEQAAERASTVTADATVARVKTIEKAVIDPRCNEAIEWANTQGPSLAE